MIVFAAVRLDVCSLQHRQDLTPRHQGAVPVPRPQGIAKMLLSPPFTDLSLDKLSPITLLRDVFRTLVRSCLVCIFGRQPEFLAASTRILRPREIPNTSRARLILSSSSRFNTPA